MQPACPATGSPARSLALATCTSHKPHVISKSRKFRTGRAEFSCSKVLLAIYMVLNYTVCTMREHEAEFPRKTCQHMVMVVAVVARRPKEVRSQNLSVKTSRQDVAPTETNADTSTTEVPLEQQQQQQQEQQQGQHASSRSSAPLPFFLFFNMLFNSKLNHF